VNKAAKISPIPIPAPIRPAVASPAPINLAAFTIVIINFKNLMSKKNKDI
jgi:hypothetical protein